MGLKFELEYNVLMAKVEATIIRLNMVDKIKNPVAKSWVNSAGMLKKYKKDLEKHIKSVRLEWGR